jgi:hypothetical protein
MSWYIMEISGCPEEKEFHWLPPNKIGERRVIYAAFEPVDHYWVEDEDDLRFT